MTTLMLIVIILAYALLWVLVIKCNRIINKTDEAGYTSRDVINHPSEAAPRRGSKNNKNTKDN